MCSASAAAAHFPTKTAMISLHTGTNTKRTHRRSIRAKNAAHYMSHERTWRRINKKRIHAIRIRLRAKCASGHTLTRPRSSITTCTSTRSRVFQHFAEATVFCRQSFGTRHRWDNKISKYLGTVVKRQPVRRSARESSRPAAVQPKQNQCCIKKDVLSTFFSIPQAGLTKHRSMYYIVREKISYIVKIFYLKYLPS